MYRLVNWQLLYAVLAAAMIQRETIYLIYLQKGFEKNVQYEFEKRLS
jgi:hypothetical protein